MSLSCKHYMDVWLIMVPTFVSVSATEGLFMYNVQVVAIRNPVGLKRNLMIGALSPQLGKPNAQSPKP